MMQIERKQHRSMPRARIEILPLIDVMFLLVAFFLVVTMSMVNQQGISVDLATGASGSKDELHQDQLVVTVTADEKFALGKDLISDSELLNKLKKIKDKEKSVIINADKNALHNSVITALDIIRQAEFHNIIFTIEPISDH